MTYTPIHDEDSPACLEGDWKWLWIGECMKHLLTSSHEGSA
jgi:hypothetical protein